MSILVREQLCAALADAWIESEQGVARFLEHWGYALAAPFCPCDAVVEIEGTYS